MRRLIPIRFAVGLLPALCFAVIIDRIVVTVGTQVITQSELELTIRLTAFMNQAPLDFSPDTRRQAAEKLVVQKLVLQELGFSKFPRPSAAEVEPILTAFIQKQFGGATAAYQAALQKYGITADELKNYRLWLLTFLRFIDFRFRPGIAVSESDIEDYFKTRILSLAQQANPGKQISLDEYHDRIERILLLQREDQQMEAWLKDQRARIKIAYIDASLQPAPQKAEAGK